MDARFAGDWMFSASNVQDECNLGPAVGPLGGPIRIMQTDNSLVLERLCCSSETIGTGTADRMFFTATSTRTVAVGPDCSYQLDEVDNGMLSGGRLNADTTVRVTCPGTCISSTWCSVSGSLLPPSCQIRGHIEATRYSSGDQICVDPLPGCRV